MIAAAVASACGDIQARQYDPAGVDDESTSPMSGAMIESVARCAGQCAVGACAGRGAGLGAGAGAPPAAGRAGGSEFL